MRGIYEPFNRLRKVVAFDTFEGFPSVSQEDGEYMKDGGYTVTPNYEDYLAHVLEFQEHESPLPHLKKHEIVKGDACETVAKYLKDNPQTLIALAYFDMDIYEPTKKVLELVKPHLTVGSVIGFDEVNDVTTPGETIALREVFGTNCHAIKRFPYNARTSYMIYGGNR